MTRDTLVSITLYGIVNEDSYLWSEWYKYSKKVVNDFGYEPNHISVESTTLKSGKVMSTKRMEKKILNSIDKGDDIEWLSIYSLPGSFESAAFDYNMLMVRSKNYISIVINENDYKKIDLEVMIKNLTKFIEFSS